MDVSVIWRGVLLSLVASNPLIAAGQDELKAVLTRQIIDARQSLNEVMSFTKSHLPPMPKGKTVAEWESHANQIRADMLERVVYRGAAATWRDAKTRVEWLGEIAGGPGYRLKKLRYEAIPGLWIPAILYEPEKLSGKVPVILNVNGHDRNGKAAPYKQIRCINQAKRGMLALNVEWLGMGQLYTESFFHGRMNQLDLCGTSGLAPFYLSMKRGLDILLAFNHADPERVAVTGLSGGGWQTIFISSLDLRVKLTDPVAGYSGYLTRIDHHKDLGDSEQTPCDMATVADYTHLTAMMAPRPTLLTFNAKDDCCFESGYALPPLLEAARPIFDLYGKGTRLRSHVNYVPGNHNYEQDNREALYKMLGDFFYAQSQASAPAVKFDAKEIPSAAELKTKEQLKVDLPTANEDFHTVAMSLAKNLPRQGALPGMLDAAREWQNTNRRRLEMLVRAKKYTVKAERIGSTTASNVRVDFWKLKLSDIWTVPVVVLERGRPQATAILINDAGRAADPVNVERLLAAGNRVLAIDPFYFGESKIAEHDSLFALLLASEGERPLGIEASQVAAVARWAVAENKSGPVTVAAVGPRSSTFALIAAALEENAVARIELEGARGSLKEVIEQNRSVEQMPELFCFGLLEAFDIKQISALVAPRPIAFIRASPRAKAELKGLKSWYTVLGKSFEPLQ